MSEEEPLRGQPEEKEEAKNAESDQKTSIDRDSLEEDDKKWESETKFQRLVSLVLYIGLLILNIFGTLIIITFLISISTSIAADAQSIWETTNYASYALIMICAIGMAFYGFSTLFRYGGTAGLLRNLDALSKLIGEQAIQLEIQTRDLASAVDALDRETRNAKERQANLAEIVQLGNEIGRLGKKVDVDDTEVSRFFGDIGMVQLAVAILKRQIIKNEMINKFYEYEQQDDLDGLSKREYEVFMNSLDKQTKDTWHDLRLSWKNLKGDDDIIDIEEFKSALDRVYDSLDRQDAQTVRDMNRQREGDF